MEPGGNKDQFIASTRKVGELGMETASQTSLDIRSDAIPHVTEPGTTPIG